MPEDDFDIYGEDESYNENVKVEVRIVVIRVRMLLMILQDAGEFEVKGFGEEGNEEFAVEPSVGDKRPREDDQETPDSAQDVTQGDAKKQLSDETRVTNGSPNTTNQASNGTSTHNAAVVSSGLTSAYDALYVGDLQWVRFLPALLRLRLYSETVVLSVHVHSGPQMKTCVKWRIISVLRLSSKTSLSPSTK